MIKRITIAIYRRGLGAVERGDYDELLRRFDDQCTLTFVGDTPLGADLSTKSEIRQWFERFGRLLPEPRFEIEDVVVDGPPWHQRLAAQVRIRSEVAEAEYENRFAHFLVLRWGKVTSDVIIEDTQRWARACERLVAAGVGEASAPPMRADRLSPIS